MDGADSEPASLGTPPALPSPPPSSPSADDVGPGRCGGLDSMAVIGNAPRAGGGTTAARLPACKRTASLPQVAPAACGASVAAANGANVVAANGGPASSRSASEDSLHSAASSNGPQLLAQSFGACVKVFVTAVAPCYALPWVRGEESHTTGSGFAALLPSGERRILVHASVLENHTLVQLRRMSEAQKYVAQVDCVGYDVDVGVLQVADEGFWRGMPLLQLPCGLPPPMSDIVTAGFPAGGEELSTARGVVNRILLVRARDGRWLATAAPAAIRADPAAPLDPRASRAVSRASCACRLTGTSTRATRVARSLR
jgi:hypothetical protein